MWVRALLLAIVRYFHCRDVMRVGFPLKEFCMGRDFVSSVFGDIFFIFAL